MRVHLYSLIQRASAAAGRSSCASSTTTSGLVSEFSEVFGVSGILGVERAVRVDFAAGQFVARRGFASIASIAEDDGRPPSLWKSAAKGVAFADSAFYKASGSIGTSPSNPSHKFLDAGAIAFERDGCNDANFKPWQSDGYQKQPWILSSMTPGLSGIFNASPRSNNNDFKDFMIVPKEITRGFAKTVAMSPNTQKPVKLRLYMGSPGIIGEPYKKPSPPLPILRRWFTMEGWKRRKQSFMAMIKTAYTVAKLRQKTKGYSQQRFYQEASDLYKQINVALAEGERTALRQLVTDNVFSIMKNELKHRENSWAKVKWEMVGPINKIRTLQGRLIGVDKNNQDNAFVQLTLRILSKQKFAAYDKNGKLVAGDPDKELLVEDYWVFEKPLLLTEAKWRLCGRLTV
ncbi:unnamed protein product [Calypogeia fissa]